MMQQLFKVPKQNGMVCLCLNLSRLNQVLIIPIQRGPTVNDILLKATNVCYVTLIDVRSGLAQSKNLTYNYHIQSHFHVSLEGTNS